MCPFLAQRKQGFAVSTVILLISELLLLDTCNSVASFAAASIPRAISCTAARVNFFSERSCFCIASLLNPQTSLSRIAWSKSSWNSQCVDNFLSSAMYWATDSPSRWFLRWNLKRSAMTIGFGSRWARNASTNAPYSLLAGLSGAIMFLNKCIRFSANHCQ